MFVLLCSSYPFSFLFMTLLRETVESLELDTLRLLYSSQNLSRLSIELTCK